MFSKRILVRTILSLLVSLFYKDILVYVSDISTLKAKIVIVLAITSLWGLFYAYKKGYFSQEKIIEKLVDHMDTPLDQFKEKK